MESIISLLLLLFIMIIPASMLVFSCIKLYRILQKKDGDYYNQAFVTAFCLCLFVIACASCVPQIFF